MYRIFINEQIAGYTMQTEPMQSFDHKPDAVDFLERSIKEAEDKLNQDYIRLVGGRIEFVFDEFIPQSGSNVIEFVAIKRPVNSPKAEIFRRNS